MNGGMRFNLKWVILKEIKNNSVTDFRTSYIRADVFQNYDFA